MWVSCVCVCESVCCEAEWSGNGRPGAKFGLVEGEGIGEARGAQSMFNAMLDALQQLTTE
jgi:hypothetical protein